MDKEYEDINMAIKFIQSKCSTEDFKLKPKIIPKFPITEEEIQYLEDCVRNTIAINLGISDAKMGDKWYNLFFEDAVRFGLNQMLKDENNPNRKYFLNKRKKHLKVWLIRHGESTANAGAKTSNHKTIPLSLKGQEQAQKISLSFQESPTLIITSLFQRAQHTAEPTIRRFPSVKCEVWDVQEFTYLAPDTCINTTAAERKARVNEYWERLDPDYVDGDGAESFNTLLSRVRTVIDRLSRFKDGLVVIFTHALFMQAFEIVRADNQEDSKSIMKRFKDLPRFDNCEILKLEV